MRNHQHEQPGSRAVWCFRWAARLCVIAGAALLTWSAVVVIDGRMSQRAARQSLETASVVSRADPRAPASAPALAPAADEAIDTPRPAPAVYTGSAIGALSIPRVHLSAVVLQGSDARTLRHGPGHLEHTALPGETGNVVIAGHRDSFFRPLRNIQVGDDIFVDTPEGRFHYEVSSLRVVNAHEVSVIEQTVAATLTLITCYPFWVLGHAPDRFVVRAMRVVELAPPIDSRTLPSSALIHAPGKWIMH